MVDDWISSTSQRAAAWYGDASEKINSVDTTAAYQTAIFMLCLYQVFGYIYNLYFHPCAKYPGPLLMRMSILPNLWYAWRGTKHLKADELHRKYGQIVRMEPGFLSIISPNSVQALYGSGSQFEKGTFYARGPKETQVLTNVATAIDKKVHGRKRRIMSHAFSEAALRSYEKTELDKIRLFCRQISDPSTFDGPYKNMSRWSSYLTYDIMGVLTFGHEYNMLTSDEDHFIQPLIDTFQHSQVVLGIVPWVERWGLAPLLFVNILLAVRRFRQYVDRQVDYRISEEKAGRGDEDIFKLLLNFKDKNTGEAMGFKELSDEAVVLIIAASDTTGTALTGLFFYLARYPECYAKLKAEIRCTFSSVEEIVTGKKLLGCKYLRACVEEALRMSPGVPGFLIRESPVDATIDGHFVPAGTQIGVPGWTKHRDPDVFPDPRVFKPERWLEAESVPGQMDRLRSASFPFSYGPRACIGKNLAYNTIYLTIARVAWLFEMESRERLPLEFHVKDHFAAGEKNGPFLKFVLRDGLKSVSG
ncbi:cytochrome P450 [Podospora australis]|uniref:Cytochrome P450 n=1 Tax=Podospora australis TaxID=1536484 RepID=A0AAN6WJ14_9PEZI|nr:cytochrome P450 [Podospora australis]